MNQKERISRRFEIEQQLQYKLDNVLEKIKLYNIKDTGIAQRVYGNEVDRNIRATTEDAYQLGVDYVTAKRKAVGFLTTLDIETIKNQTQKYAMSFWRKADMLIHRNDTLLQKYNYEPRSPLNSNYMATSISIGVVTTTMALATKQKLLVLANQFKSAVVRKRCPKGQHWDNTKKTCVENETVPVAPVLPLTSEQQQDNANDEFLNNVIATAPLALTSLLFLNQDEYGNYGIEPSPEAQLVKNYKLQWNAILDTKTCQVCESLDTTVWDPNDPALPTPGDDGDIHFNCRCFYDIIESDEDLYEGLGIP